MSGQRKSRRRGVRLNDLDRDQWYVIGHNGQRWETVGVLTDSDAVGPVGVPGPGAGAEGPRTVRAPGRHADSGCVGSVGS